MDENPHLLQISDDLMAVGLLKFELLASGLRISSEAMEHMRGTKTPIRTRSGASGGLDIILPHNIYVNCPVIEHFATESALVLDHVSSGLVIKRGEEMLSPVKLQETPRYYDLVTSDGVPMVKVGQICSGDRFCYGMTGPFCVFWKSSSRCKFCSIGLNRDRDAARKTVKQMLETLAAAVEDDILPARHVLLGGGTPNTEDAGAILASELCQTIKSHFGLSCYVMIAAPSKNEYIDMLWDSGADELGMNIEFYSDAAWEKYIPGKCEFIGKKRYFDALEYAVSRFGPINTRSILMVGLEDPEFTIQGAQRLASIGVMPILSPFRPLNGTELENVRGFDHKTYFDLYVEAQNRSMSYGIPVGPTCIPCQNNTLALPLPGHLFRFY